MSSIDEAGSCLQEVKSLHPKARHFCYAYRLGIEGEPHRVNDDGEPSGTAGKPILGQMLSFEVSDCMAVVVRYFGGTKLGASGLINAYKTATREALAKGTKREVILGQKYELSFIYSEMGHVMNVIKSMNLDILEKSFEASPSVIINIRNSEVTETMTLLKAKLLNISTEQITEKTEVPFCKIQSI